MHPPRRRLTLWQMILAVAGVPVMAWLAFAAASSAQQTPSGTSPRPDGAKGRPFSGRVVDGLGRAVPGVRVTVQSYRKPGEEAQETVLTTGADGRYSGTLAPDHDASLTFEREGYGRWSAGPALRAEITLHRKIDWDEASSIPYQDGDAVDRGVRELLASEEWDDRDEELLNFVFKEQDQFRPALRRLIHDPHVGATARDWLDLLNNPADRDLFVKGRQYAPKKAVKETDLIEALKATARQRNFFSSAPEPQITIDFMVFTDDLDRALIQCGINRVAMTGITWQFVFRKVGKQWELQSAKEAGRS